MSDASIRDIPRIKELLDQAKSMFRQIRENEEDKKRLQEWRLREIVVRKDVPIAGEPVIFAEGSPERAVVEFLYYWKARNYGRMAEYLPDATGPISKVAGEVRQTYGSTRLDRFAIEQVTDKAPAITIVKVRLWYDRTGDFGEAVLDFRVLSQDADGHPAVRGKPGATWRLATWPLIELEDYRNHNRYD